MVLSGEGKSQDAAHLLWPSVVYIYIYPFIIETLSSLCLKNILSSSPCPPPAPLWWVRLPPRHHQASTSGWVPGSRLERCNEPVGGNPREVHQYTTYHHHYNKTKKIMKLMLKNQPLPPPPPAPEVCLGPTGIRPLTGRLTWEGLITVIFILVFVVVVVLLLLLSMFVVVVADSLSGSSYRLSQTLSLFLSECLIMTHRL